MNLCTKCNVYESVEKLGMCIKCDGRFNRESPDENAKQVIQAFHLLTAALYNLTIQYYKPSHPMSIPYRKVWNAIDEMEAYLKETYPDQFSDSFGENES